MIGIEIFDISKSKLFSISKYFIVSLVNIIIILQVESGLVAAANGDNAVLQQTLSQVEATLNVLADSVLQEQPLLRRKKLEHLVGCTITIIIYWYLI